MIAIVHSIYSQSVHALALNAGLKDNDTERYCNYSNACLAHARFPRKRNVKTF